MKSTNNENFKNWEKLWVSKKSGLITKTLVALSTVFVLWQQPAKANFSNTNMVNTITTNMLNISMLVIILDDDKPKSPEAKKVIKEIKKILTEFNINDKLALKDYLGLLSKLHKKEIKTIDFIKLFMELWEKYKLSSDDTIRLLNKFIKKNYMPETFFINLRKYINTSFMELYSFYWDKTDDKLNKIIEIYDKKWTFSKEDIEKVIPEFLLNQEKERRKMATDVFYILLIVTIIFWGIIYYAENS